MTIQQIINLIEKIPNDMELGSKIRELYFKHKKNG